MPILARLPRLLRQAFLLCFVFGAHAGAAHADALDQVLQVLSTAGVIDPAVVEAKPMIQCVIDGGKSLDQCADYAAGKAQGLVPNDPKIQKVIGVFKAVQQQDWLKVFLLAGEQVVCSLVPGGAVKDLFCGEVFQIAKPVITSAYSAVRDGDILKLVSVLGVEYACDLLPSAPGASELCGVLGEIVQGVAKTVGAATKAIGNLAEDIAGQGQHMPVEEYYVTQWRNWLQYAVMQRLRTGSGGWLWAGRYGGTPCEEYFDSHKMSASNAEKVCDIMKKRFQLEVDESVQVYQAFPSTFFSGALQPRVPGLAAAYHDAIGASPVPKNAAGYWIRLYYAKSKDPFRFAIERCLSRSPLALPPLPGPNDGLSIADQELLGTAHGWACTQVVDRLAIALQQQKMKIASLAGKLTATGCHKITPIPALHYSCPTYASHQQCVAVYPSGESPKESLCWVDMYNADPALAQSVVQELGTKRCALAPKAGQVKLINVQCTRPWKQGKCKSLVAAGTQGAPYPSGVGCLYKVDPAYTAGRQQAQSLIKSLNAKPTGGGFVDPKTGTTQKLAIVTGAKCLNAPEGQWDPLRISCEDPEARKALGAKLPTCLNDPGKHGADAPCHDGPLTSEAPVAPTSVAKPAGPVLPVDTRPVNVRFTFFERSGRGWARTDTPARGAMVAVSCEYAYAPEGHGHPAWSIAFVEGNANLLDRAHGPGLVDRASGRVTRTWYGTLLQPGPIELGCVTDFDKQLGEGNTADNRLVRRIDVPGARRTTASSAPTASAKPRIARASTVQAAQARNGEPAIDLQFAEFAGIKRIGDPSGARRATSTREARVGEPLVIECSYQVNMDAPNGEPIVLSPWRASISQSGKPARQIAGATKVVSVRGLSTAQLLQQRWTPSAPGDYTFSCMLDGDNTAAETDETNNRLDLPIRIIARAARPGAR